MVTDILTSSEAAAYLRLSAPTLRRKADAGDIPGAKVGRQWRFRRRDLDAWVRRGGDRYEELVDEGMALVMAERMADPANSKTRPLEDVLRERGL